MDEALFREKGFKIKNNIIFQVKQNTIKLAMNARESSGIITQYFCIKCFYITDLIKKKVII